MTSIIVAIAKNNVIGKSNDLPWYLPADLKHFKEITTGHTVVMGRKTFDSILARLGKPLPNRTNIVVTRDKTFESPGAIAVNSLEEVLNFNDSQELFIIGGAEIYKQSLEKADRLYVTEVDAEIDGDTYFPVIDKNIWHETSRDTYAADEKNPYDYAFVVYERL